MIWIQFHLISFKYPGWLFTNFWWAFSTNWCFTSYCKSCFKNVANLTWESKNRIRRWGPGSLSPYIVLFIIWTCCKYRKWYCCLIFYYCWFVHYSNRYLFTSVIVTCLSFVENPPGESNSVTILSLTYLGKAKARLEINRGLRYLIQVSPLNTDRLILWYWKTMFFMANT